MTGNRNRRLAELKAEIIREYRVDLAAKLREFADFKAVTFESQRVFSVDVIADMIDPEMLMDVEDAIEWPSDL